MIFIKQGYAQLQIGAPSCRVYGFQPCATRYGDGPQLTQKVATSSNSSLAISVRLAIILRFQTLQTFAPCRSPASD